MKKKTGRIFLTALLSLCTVQITTNALAEEASSDNVVEKIWNSDKLTGEWWGGRTWLSKHGIDLDFRLSQYYQGVTSGGVDTNSEYGGTLDYRLNINGDKLGFFWKGFSVNMHARTRFGQDVSADAGSLVLENTGMLMPAPADYHGTDITGLIASQNFSFFGTPANFTLGKLDILDTATGLFPNVAYGQEGFWNVNAMLTAMPWFGAIQGLSLYGGLGITINTEYKMPQSGILVTGTESVTTSWGSLSDSFDDVWIAGFHRFFWKMDEDKTGYFMIFAGASTKEQASNDPYDFIDIPGQGIESTDQDRPWDLAFYLYQEFWQAQGDPNRKANIMIGATVGPDNPQFAQWNFFANVESFGLFESRPHDRMGAGAWYNGLSDNFVDLLASEIELRDTWGFEFYYNLAINKWMYLSPDIQFVQNEREEDSFAVIPGIRLVIDL